MEMVNGEWAMVNGKWVLKDGDALDSSTIDHKPSLLPAIIHLTITHR